MGSVRVLLQGFDYKGLVSRVYTGFRFESLRQPGRIKDTTTTDKKHKTSV